ncbi:hypothetical protein Esti_002538 [Eimeria stiedai]
MRPVCARLTADTHHPGGQGKAWSARACSALPRSPAPPSPPSLRDCAACYRGFHTLRTADLRHPLGRLTPDTELGEQARAKVKELARMGCEKGMMASGKEVGGLFLQFHEGIPDCFVLLEAALDECLREWGSVSAGLQRVALEPKPKDRMRLLSRVSPNELPHMLHESRSNGRGGGLQAFVAAAVGSALKPQSLSFFNPRRPLQQQQQQLRGDFVLLATADQLKLLPAADVRRRPSSRTRTFITAVNSELGSCMGRRIERAAQSSPAEGEVLLHPPSNWVA